MKDPKVEWKCPKCSNKKDWSWPRIVCITVLVWLVLSIIFVLTADYSPPKFKI